ncbi:Aldose sugar dehydrogenase YliI [Thalassocella blandensis]|nr:Aldose sugar dehydrogenase YliI [Thalassocella blandensis]
MQIVNTLLHTIKKQQTVIGLATALLATMNSSGVSAQAPSATDFQRVVVAENLNLPMEFEISEDGRIFVVSKCGEFYGWNIDGEPVTTARSFVPGVRCPFEDGLLSIALDPDFTENNYVYMQYMIDGELTRVGRYTVNPDFTLDLDSYTLIIEWFSRESSGHAGGSMLFDNEGNLIITTGDNNGATGYYSSGGQVTSGNTNDLRGKVLRIKPLPEGGYSIPAGNLFAADGQHRPEIYAMGFRNPFRINIDKQTGYLYVGDVGPDASADSEEGPGGLDELNEIRQAGNFGWPWVLGFNQPYAGFDPYNLTNNHQDNTGATNIPDAEPALWTVRHRATMSGPVYRYNPNIDNDYRLPPYYDGQLIFWDFNSSQFFAFPVDATALPPIEEKINIKTQGVQGAIDMEFDPRNQNFYMLQWGSGCCDKEPFNNGILYRFEYIGGRDSGTNYALGGTATASTEAGGNSAMDAIDGDKENTRWESEHSDPHQWNLTLTESIVIDTIVITWENAYSSVYTIEGSLDGTNWDLLVDETNGAGGVSLHIINNPNTYRYLRFNGTGRGTAYGHSFYEFEVYAAEEEPEPTPLPELAYLNMPQTLDANFTGVPTLLSQTGVFSDTANMVPIDNMVPYEPNAKLWSDRAVKERWISLPANSKISWSENDNWTYPEGTVAVKHFELPLDENNPALVKRLETRLMVMKKDGTVYGVTYKWNDAQTDAELLTETVDEDITITAAGGATYTQTWTYPTAQCLDCHNSASSQILGPNTRQLNGNYNYPGGNNENQLVHWNNAGMFEPAFNNAMVDSFAKTVSLDDASASLEQRVKSYLDANCAHCHGTGNGGSQWDGRYNTPVEEMKVVDAETTGIRNYFDYYGLENAQVISTMGGPEESVMFIRTKSEDPDDRMPPLGRAMEHPEFTEVLAAWINGMGAGTPTPTPTATPTPTPTPTFAPGVELVSLNKAVSSSTGESSEILARAVDGSAGTLWSSDFASAQWITVDLGASYDIDRIVLDWEAAYSSGYSVQGSVDNFTWSTIITQANSSSCMEQHTNLNGVYRYIRVQREQASNGWGYGLWEISVYGVAATPTATPTPTTTVMPTPTPTTTVTPTPTPTPTAPEISVASPTANQQFVTGTNINLSVAITDNNWFANGGSYQYRLNNSTAVGVNSATPVSLGQLVIGNYSVEVQLYDANAQAIGDADSISFAVVSGEPTGPLPSPAKLSVTAVAVSSEQGGNIGADAVDGDPQSRWESEHSDPQWIQLDFGESKFLTKVVLNWEAAYSSAYELQVSDNGNEWETIYSTTSGNGNFDEINLNGEEGRYIRMYGTARGTGYGHSIEEFEVYGLTADPALPLLNVIAPSNGADIPETEAINLQINVTDPNWFVNGGSYQYSLDHAAPVRIHTANAVNLGQLNTGLHSMTLNLLDSDGNVGSVERRLNFTVNCGDNCPNVLVFSKTSGFRHGSIEAGVAMVQELADTYGYGFTHTEDSSVFTNENLADYSTIVFMNTTGDIFTDDQKAAFKAYIENGGGYVGTHSAADTEHNWEWYTDTLLAGAEFDHHGDGIPTARVEIEKPTDTLVGHIGTEWIIGDEWYFWKGNPRGVGNVEVLANLDRSSYESNYPVEDHPVVFKNSVGEGRIFYTAVGHVDANFSEENMVEMIRKAIEWTSQD